MNEVKDFKSVSVSASDYDEYEELRDLVSKELGAKLSVAAVLKIAVKFYKDRRRFEK